MIGEKIHRFFNKDYARRCDKAREDAEQRRRKQLEEIEKWWDEENERRKQHPDSVRILEYYFEDDRYIYCLAHELTPQEIAALEKIHGKAKSAEHYVFIKGEPPKKEEPKETSEEKNGDPWEG